MILTAKDVTDDAIDAHNMLLVDGGGCTHVVWSKGVDFMGLSQEQLC